MSELFEAVVSWRLLLGAVVVYGFAPGFLLRLIVRLYPRDDPRRAELVAELYTVPRPWRPFWVAEQLETGLFEGLHTRRRARLDRQRAARDRTGSVALAIAIAGAATVVAVVAVVINIATTADVSAGAVVIVAVVVIAVAALAVAVALLRWGRRRRPGDE